MKELIRSEKYWYTLTESEQGRLTLSVICGGIAMYERKLDLNEDETRRFREEGEPFLDRVALKVCKGWPGFAERAY